MNSGSAPPSFEFGVRLGIFLTVESAGLSALAVSTLLGYIAYRTYKRIQFRRQLRKQSGARGDFAFDATDSSFFLNLMVADLIQALGGLLNIKWVAEAHITEGSYCTAQGVLKQMGDVGVALTSLAIAFETFFVLVLRVHAPAYVNKIVIATIWTFIVLVIGIGGGINNKQGKYYGNTIYWCWIKAEYNVERIVFEYLWLWLAGGIMLILYGIITLVMRGVLDFSTGIQLHRKNRIKTDISTSDYDKLRNPKKTIANLMLFYPAVYIFCILPVCIVRWLDFNGQPVPPAATIFASVIFSFSGLFNVTLYYFTRPQLITGPRLPTRDKHDAKSNQEPIQGLRHKLGQLPVDQGSLPDVEDVPGYIPTSPPHSHVDGRLLDFDYGSNHVRMDSLPPGAGYGQQRSPNTEYEMNRSQLLSTDYRSGQSPWSAAPERRPSTCGTETSVVSFTTKQSLGRLPDL